MRINCEPFAFFLNWVLCFEQELCGVIGRKFLEKQKNICVDEVMCTREKREMCTQNTCKSLFGTTHQLSNWGEELLKENEEEEDGM